MSVLVDTTAWSVMLRRPKIPQSSADRSVIVEVKSLVAEKRARMIGPIRQEILTGIREPAQFEKLRTVLRGFEDESLSLEDFETAAEFANRCRGRGIAGSSVDLLICAAAFRRDWAIFTLDQDFDHFSRVLPIRRHPIRPAVH